VCGTYEKELRTGSGAAVFTSESESGNKRWADLKIRTVEHVCSYLFTYFSSFFQFYQFQWHKMSAWFSKCQWVITVTLNTIGDSDVLTRTILELLRDLWKSQ